MASYQIRPADLARDRDAFCAFVMGSQHVEHAMERNRSLDPAVGEAHLTALLDRAAREPCRMLTAVDGAGVPIGWGVAYDAMDEVFVRPEERRHVYIAELFVDEAWRGRGVGGALIAAFEGWAKELGIGVMQLGVLPGNDRARAVYGKAGYSTYALQLRKYL